MKYIKTYAIHGMVEKSCLFSLGRNTVRVDFRHGSVTTAGIQPARFKTSNAVLQFAIENSPKFKRGEIVLEESVKIKEAKQEDSKNKKEVEISVDTYPEVTNSQQAKSILMDKYEVSLSELQNKEAILKRAAELNVKFPNWN